MNQENAECQLQSRDSYFEQAFGEIVAYANRKWTEMKKAPRELAPAQVRAASSQFKQFFFRARTAVSVFRGKTYLVRTYLHE